MKQILSVVLKRQADTLIRLTGLCYRKGVTIENLSYVATPSTSEVSFRAVLTCERTAANQLYRQVSKLIGVIGAEIAPYKEGGM